MVNKMPQVKKLPFCQGKFSHHKSHEVEKTMIHFRKFGFVEESNGDIVNRKQFQSKYRLDLYVGSSPRN